jgi:hypothetical protein
MNNFKCYSEFNKLYKKQIASTTKANCEIENVLSKYFEISIARGLVEIASFNLAFDMCAEIIYENYVIKGRSNNTLSNELICILGQSEIENVKEKVDLIDYKRHDEYFQKKFKDNQIHATLFNTPIIFTNSFLDVDFEQEIEDDETSLRKACKKYFIPKPEVLRVRNKIAKIIKTQMNIPDDELINLPDKIFNKILQIISNKKLKETDTTTITFLERYISTYHPNFLDCLDINSQKHSLANLRRKSTNKYNTICHECNKKLRKINNYTLCSKYENRACFEKRKRYFKTANIEFEKSLLKNTCSICQAKCNSKIRHKDLFFCSPRHKETYLKRQQRKKFLLN